MPDARMGRAAKENGTYGNLQNEIFDWLPRLTRRACAWLSDEARKKNDAGVEIYTRGGGVAGDRDGPAKDCVKFSTLPQTDCSKFSTNFAGGGMTAPRASHSSACPWQRRACTARTKSIDH